MRTIGPVLVLTCMTTVGGMAYADDPTGDPLAQARSGKIACYEPNFATHQCSGIYRYSWGADGKITVLNEGVVRGTKGLVRSTREQVVVRDGVQCWPYDPNAEIEGTWRQAGKPLDPDETRRRNQFMADELPYPPGTLICLHPKREGDLWRNDVTTGEGLPEQGTRAYVWVDPADGWHLPGDR